MQKTYEKPSLEKVASLQKFTAATETIPSYCYELSAVTEAKECPL